MGTPAMGHQAELAMDPSTFDTDSQPFEFTGTVGLKARTDVVHNEGIRGTRQRSKERNRLGLVDVSGPITMNPTITEWRWILDYFGFTESPTDTWKTAEALTAFNVMVDRVTKVHTYNGCVIGSAIIRGQAGQMVELVLNLVGKTESEGNAGTFPALSIDTGSPYFFTDGAVTLESASRDVESFELIIDNLVEAKYRNNRTADQIVSNGQNISLAVTTPYSTDEDDLYTTPFGSSAGAAGSLVLNDGTNTLTFSLANLIANAETPDVPGKSEIVYPHTYQAYKSGSTDIITVTIA